MTTGKTIALSRQTFVGTVMSPLFNMLSRTRWTFVGKEISLLFNMLSRLVITFLPKSRCLNVMAAITICSDFGTPKIKSDTVYTVSPSICHKVMGPDAMIFVF